MSALSARQQPERRSNAIEDVVGLARKILRDEGDALIQLARRLSGDAFAAAVELIERCRGRIIVSGMGKAGLIGRKLAATFCSTGTPSHFLHPAEAIHGDLGCVATTDVVLLLSASGETEEILRLLPNLVRLAVPLIAITCRGSSSLARAANVVLELGELREACPLGLAPTTSTTLMMALGDALALVVSQRRGFTARDFARFHPGGSLGRKLTYVEEVMRPLAECRIASDQLSVRQVIVSQSRPGRRTGAIMLLDETGRLSGIFTDSDLARLIAQSQDTALDQPICQVMTRTPKTIPAGKPLECALELLQEYKISELPVVDPSGRPLGLIDITDVIGWPGGAASTPTPVTLPIPALRAGPHNP